MLVLYTLDPLERHQPDDKYLSQSAWKNSSSRRR
jgi:hypothetical protein